LFYGFHFVAFADFSACFYKTLRSVLVNRFSLGRGYSCR